MVTTASSSVIVALASQSVWGLEISPHFRGIERINQAATTPMALIQNSSLISSSNRAIPVQDSVLSTPIPQPITGIFFLVMGGLGGFFKLKIAHAKLQQSSEES
ncbi:hypothetical protein [Rippkaea orientalis]|nr:hypothetical protein [Rippkaea orientalis]